ncbi:hypothetical protein BDN72DRAFT_876133 [Pluteus cervinus]|uniref:Uncharacterized protein n=1 Tax=Pluteus cervinus TaxID=181527 RepID=A0ACD3B4P9_9AGAR|nr:hypothetical protein BDN72DRAFT_876133 [Pluteus cervinus]
MTQAYASNDHERIDSQETEVITPVPAQSFIHLLPDELLEDIFLLSIDNFQPSSSSTKGILRTRSTILGVCQRWRDIGLSFSRLWSYIRVSVGKSQRTDRLISILEKQLTRAKGLPLTISIRSTRCCPEVVEALMPYSNQWYSFDLYAPSSMHRSFVLVKGKLALLHRLKLRIRSHWDWNTPPNFDIVSNIYHPAPSLKYMDTVDFANKIHTSFPFPWRHLTSWSGSISSINEIRRLATQVSDLQTLKLEEWVSPRPTHQYPVVKSNPEANLSLTHLEYLQIHIKSPSAERLNLSHLPACPRLRRLVIWQRVNRTTSDTEPLRLSHFLLSVSDSLTTFEYMTAYPITDVISLLGSSAPNLLVNLRINSDSTSVDVRKVFNQLRYLQSGDPAERWMPPAIFPRLENLHLSFNASVDLPNALVSTIRSRWPSDSSQILHPTARLRSVVLEFAPPREGSFSRSEKKLRELCQEFEGLEASLAVRKSIIFPWPCEPGLNEVGTMETY